MMINLCSSLLFLLSAARVSDAADPLTCSLADNHDETLDSALKEMTYDVGDGPQTTMVYVEPDIKSFYNGNDNLPATTKVKPKFAGFSVKFINNSNKKVSLYWEEREGGKMHEMRHHNPFTSSGSASFPGHRFLFTEFDNPDAVLQRFVVTEYPNNIYYYDPYLVPNDPAATESNLQNALTKDEREQYNIWWKTQRFHEHYLNTTGRSYLANYLRPPPRHKLWPADYFGQEHWIETRETHFTQHPPVDELTPILSENRVLQDSDPRLLQRYRDATQSTLNMTLRVLSVAPRVFDVPNFLSETEVEHILNLAAGIDLKESITGFSEAGEKRVTKDTRKTRTSFNSWVERERNPITDAIYRRAADLMRMDEALLRTRRPDEVKRLQTLNERSMGERLQLVHYDVTQEYTAHHDFAFTKAEDEHQGARFATLLLYLNDPERGGETSFPRYVNAETFKELKVEPKAGRAVLFYSQLPDGNFDDFSQHAALPIKEGEKWLINLWVWDPTYR